MELPETCRLCLGGVRVRGPAMVRSRVVVITFATTTCIKRREKCWLYIGRGNVETVHLLTLAECWLLFVSWISHVVTCHLLISQYNFSCWCWLYNHRWLSVYFTCLLSVWLCVWLSVFLAGFLIVCCPSVYWPVSMYACLTFFPVCSDKNVTSFIFNMDLRYFKVL